MAGFLPRLHKFLLIALSTDQEGEAKAACSAIVKLLAREGKDIHWLADRLTATEKWSPFVLPTAGWHEASWMEMIDYCAEDDALNFMRANEIDFINSLWHQRRERESWRPSVRQMNWLKTIHAKVKNGRAAMSPSN